MKTWKVWALTIPILLLMIAFAMFIWLWNNFKSNWQAEQSAATFVLNHTPVQHLQSYHVFTAASLEDVFSGSDAFGRKCYAFYVASQHAAYSVLQSTLIKPSIVESTLRSQHIDPLQLSVGYIPDNQTSAFKPTNHVVYEVRGRAGNSVTYVYVDAVSGKILWKYVL